MKPNTWHYCYDDGWQNDIVPEAFTHPAKFSRGLIRRIYLHAKEQGWVKAGDWVLDPFGGVALGALEALGMGLNWVGVELEEKFVKLGEQNIAKWNRDLQSWHNLGTAKIIQGDSRNLKGVIEKADCVISSPPFQGVEPTQDDNFRYKGSKLGSTGSHYGHTPGNLANLKEGNIDAVISSPPYEASLDRSKNAGRAENIKRRKLKMQYGGLASYSGSPGQMGNFKGDTFWSASKEIVQECYDLLKDGGHAIWVCKDYIKKGKRVPFSDRWATLCESVGFKLVCRHRAMLVKYHGTQILIEGEHKIETHRKSFFRRLHEKKYPHLAINYEDVLCLVKD